MTRDQIVAAVESGLPFTIHTADGKEYPVPHRDYIFVPPKAAHVFVHFDDGRFVVLPMLTMTGLESRALEQDAGAAKKS